MNKLVNSFSSLISRILAFALVLVGYGCSSDDEETQLMYGTPVGTFEVKGSVTATKGTTTEPAEASVIVTMPDLPSSVANLGVVETSSDGKYIFSGSSLANKLKVVCLPKDAKLEPDSVVVDAKYVSVPGNSDSWMIGHAEITADFNLKEKKTEE